MRHDLVSRYIWIIDMLLRHQRLTRDELNKHWIRSALSDGMPIPERTFYHHRRAIEDNFHIEIKCDRQGRYYIDEEVSAKNRAITNWMLDSMAVSHTLQDNNAQAGRIEIEDVPSAREFLPLALDAIKDSLKISFTYSGFNRSRPETKIIFHPYFLKRYKQRWYMIGLKEKGKSIRTYALDRVSEMKLTGDTFEMPGSLTIDHLFSNIVGVTTSLADVKTVRLKTTPMQAKYFRALPLHHSQQEEVHDEYSVFTYQLQLNYELAHEILALGDAVKVLDPPELKAMVVTQLQAALNQYQ